MLLDDSAIMLLDDSAIMLLDESAICCNVFVWKLKSQELTKVAFVFPK